MGFSDSHHFRKMIAGVCMVVGPLLALASFVVSPALHTKVAAQLGSYAAHPDRTLLSVLFGIAAVAFVIVATLGLMHMLRERMVSYGNVGGGMALLGLVLAMASMGVGFVFWAMIKDGVQPADVAAAHKISHSGIGLVTLYIRSSARSATSCSPQGCGARRRSIGGWARRWRSAWSRSTCPDPQRASCSASSGRRSSSSASGRSAR